MSLFSSNAYANELHKLIVKADNYNINVSTGMSKTTITDRIEGVEQFSIDKQGNITISGKTYDQIQTTMADNTLTVSAKADALEIEIGVFKLFSNFYALSQDADIASVKILGPAKDKDANWGILSECTTVDGVKRIIPLSNTSDYLLSNQYLYSVVLGEDGRINGDIKKGLDGLYSLNDYATGKSFTISNNIADAKSILNSLELVKDTQGNQYFNFTQAGAQYLLGGENFTNILETDINTTATAVINNSVITHLEHKRIDVNGTEVIEIFDVGQASPHTTFRYDDINSAIILDKNSKKPVYLFDQTGSGFAGKVVYNSDTDSFDMEKSDGSVIPFNSDGRMPSSISLEAENYDGLQCVEPTSAAGEAILISMGFSPVVKNDNTVLFERQGLLQNTTTLLVEQLDFINEKFVDAYKDNASNILLYRDIIDMTNTELQTREVNFGVAWGVYDKANDTVTFNVNGERIEYVGNKSLSIMADLNTNNYEIKSVSAIEYNTNGVTLIGSINSGAKSFDRDFTLGILDKSPQNSVIAIDSFVNNLESIIKQKLFSKGHVNYPEGKWQSACESLYNNISDYEEGNTVYFANAMMKKDLGLPLTSAEETVFNRHIEDVKTNVINSQLNWARGTMLNVFYDDSTTDMRFDSTICDDVVSRNFAKDIIASDDAMLSIMGGPDNVLNIDRGDYADSANTKATQVMFALTANALSKCDSYVDAMNLAEASSFDKDKVGHIFTIVKANPEKWDKNWSIQDDFSDIMTAAGDATWQEGVAYGVTKLVRLNAENQIIATKYVSAVSQVSTVGAKAVSYIPSAVIAVRNSMDILNDDSYDDWVVETEIITVNGLTFVAGTLAGIVIGGITMPVTATILAGTTAGYVINEIGEYTVDYFKNSHLADKYGEGFVPEINDAMKNRYYYDLVQKLMVANAQN